MKPALKQKPLCAPATMSKTPAGCVTKYCCLGVLAAIDGRLTMGPQGDSRDGYVETYASLPGSQKSALRISLMTLNDLVLRHRSGPPVKKTFTQEIPT